VGVEITDSLYVVLNMRIMSRMGKVALDELGKSDDFNRGIAALKRFDLRYDILIFEKHLPQTIQFVDRHPDQIFILDHVAKPRIRDRVLLPWRENIRELARRANVYCKISGLVTEADWHT